MAENQNAYAILGIHKGASEKDIKNCYINLVKKYDPERHTERFMVIQAAYEKLRQPKTRAKEDVFTFNPAMGEYLYNDSEKSDGAAPAEIDISRARVEFAENSTDEKVKQKLITLLFQRAHYAQTRRQLSDALRDWNEILEIDPSHIRARHNVELASCSLGLSYAMHGLSEEAIELLERALQLNPDNTAVIHNLALVSERARDPERAGRYWGETVNRWKAQLSAGGADEEYLRNCIVEALNHHGEYMETHPIAPRATASQAAVPKLSSPMPSSTTVPKLPATPPPAGSPPPASPAPAVSPVPAAASSTPLLAHGLDRYREIAKLKPDDFEAQFTLCNKLMENQLWEEATAELKKLSVKHPKNTEVLNVLGWAALNGGHKDEAFLHWKRALSIDPNNTQTRENLVKAHMTLGKNFRAKGLFTHALVHFKQLLALLPKNPDVHLEIAATYDMKGDVRSATNEYNTVLALDPKNKVARKAVNDLRMKR